MTFEADIAPVVDRLVLAVNTATRAEAHDAFEAIRAEEGIESPELPGHYAEFLLAGRLTEQLAVARLHYMDPDRISTTLATWAARGLTIADGERLAAAPGLARLASTILDTRRTVATRLWDGHLPEVERAIGVISPMLGHLPTRYLLASEHAALTPPADPFQRLHQHLTTMRYVRSQCHAEAWRARGMHRDEIAAMTRAWHEGRLEGEDLALRLDIEADTNTCNAAEFEPLDTVARSDLLAALTALPGDQA